MGLADPEMQKTQFAPLVRLSTKVSFVMEHALKTTLTKLTLLATSAATQQTALIIKVGIGAATFACQRVPPATAATKL